MTVTAIVNKALSGIGAQLITALDDGSNNADTAALFYDDARQEILRSANWGFARKTAILEEASPTPTGIPGTHAYVYDKPSDLVKFQHVDETNTPIERHGEYYLSDDSEVTLTYLWDVGAAAADPDETDLFPPHFVAALIAKLRSVLATPLGGRNARRTNWDQLYTFELERAISTEGTEESPNQAKYGVNTDSDPWVGKARY